MKMKIEKFSYPKIIPWLMWFFGASFLLYQFLLQTSISVIMGKLQQAFDINAASVGLISASFFYPYFLMQVPGGLLVDRFGPRKVLTWGFCICVVGVMFFAHAQNFWVAASSRMLMGLVAAPAFAGALYLIANWFSPKKFALLSGLTESFAMLGGVLGQVAVAQRVASAGWRITFIDCAIIGLVLTICTGLIIRDRPRNSLNVCLASTKLSIIRQHFKKVMGLPQVWLIGLFSGLTFALVSAFGGLWCVPYLEVRYGLPATITSIASSMIFIGVAVGSPFLGWLSDHIGKRKPVMFYSALLCLLLMLIALYFPKVPFGLMIFLLFLVGATASVYMLPFALVREITPKETRGTAMGFANMMSIFIGSPVLQPLIGKFLELDWDGKNVNGIQVFHLTDYQISLAILPLCLLLSLIIWCFIRETNCCEVAAIAAEVVTVAADKNSCILSEK